MSDEFAEDPLVRLARELRQGAGAEIKAEAEAVELDVERARLRRRTLREVAGETAARGDRVSVVAPGRTITGEIRHVGRDYLSVETLTEIVDARLEAVVMAITPSTTGGFSGRGGAVTFRARLAEFEQTGEWVELIASRILHVVRGVVAVVADDHVVARDEGGVSTVFPLALVDLVIRPLPPRPR
jgi:hypothetical protein